MGIKGDKHTQVGENAADELVENLSEIDDITSKKMFGGNGIFHEGRMFGMIDSNGKAFLKTDEFLEERFVAAGAEKHGRMPYYSIPKEVLMDSVELVKWAKDSIRASKE